MLRKLPSSKSGYSRATLLEAELGPSCGRLVCSSRSYLLPFPTAPNHLSCCTPHRSSYTMSGRKLGGGRVLGSGKGLAPPASPSVARPRAPSPLAPPSESEVSIGSSSLSPPASSSLADLGQDIGSSISVGAQGKGGTDASALVCPICSEEMVCHDPAGFVEKRKKLCADDSRSHCSNSIDTSTTTTRNWPRTRWTRSRRGSTSRS